VLRATLINPHGLCGRGRPFKARLERRAASWPATQSAAGAAYLLRFTPAAAVMSIFE